MELKRRRKGRYKVAEKFVNKNKNSGKSKGNIEKGTKEDKTVCRQKKKKRRQILKRELSNAKYKRLEVINKKEKNGKTDKAVCRPIQSKKSCFNKYN